MLPVVGRGMWPVMTEVKKQREGMNYTKCLKLILCYEGWGFVCLFVFLPSEHREIFWQLFCSLFHVYLNSKLSSLFCEPPPRPQPNPLPTMLMADQSHSYQLERSRTHRLLNLGHSSFHSCTRSKCCQGLCPLQPEVSQPWTSATAGKSL